MNFNRALNKAILKKIIFYFGCLFIFISIWRYWRKHPTRHLPNHLRKYLRFNEKYMVETILNKSEIDHLKVKLEKWNANLQILNCERYGPVTPETSIFAIQVHRDAERLQYLIISLAQVRFIQDVLIIFSHSYYNETLNNFVRNITFCKVMQIFYTYSLQLDPSKFPGLDSDNCQDSVTTNLQEDCIERNGHMTEQKQHWWWKANMIFDNMEWSYKHKGLVIFLEEDNYVLPDILYMLKYAQHALVHIPAPDVVSFGGAYARDLDSNIFTVDTWRPTYDKGLAFNKTTWKRILTLSSHYCAYDDVSWSYSLLSLFSKFRNGRAEMIASLFPRVISTGMYRSGRLAMDSILNGLHDKKMFPTKVKAVMLYNQVGKVEQKPKVPRGNGGWNGMHDHLLCLDPLISTYSEDRDEETTPSIVFT